jgi:MOSC domain-containing protein YiiM
MARLLSTNVGLPRDIEWKGRTVHTGIWKDPVRGRCRVGRLNVDGDGQGDLHGHGGEQRASSSTKSNRIAIGGSSSEDRLRLRTV